MSSSAPEKKPAAAAAAPAPAAPIGAQLMDLVKTLQFAWFIGHVVSLCFSMLYVFTRRPAMYTVALIGVLESFGIITYQHFFLKPAAKDTSLNFGNLVSNENVLYFVLALLWFVTPRLSLSLVPYMMFSLFHILIYLKNIMLPQVFGLDAENSKLVRFIATFVQDYNERCMHWVGTVELGLLVVTILRAILWCQKSWIVLVLYALFIKIRYENSKYMKSAFAQWRVRLDGVFSHQSVPPAVKQYYNKAKNGLISLSQYQISHRAQQQPAAKKE